MRAECPAESGSRKVQLFTARQKAKNASFVTVLVPFKNRTRKKAITISLDGANLSFETEIGTNVVVSKEFGERPELLPSARQVRSIR